MPHLDPGLARMSSVIKDRLPHDAQHALAVCEELRAAATLEGDNRHRDAVLLLLLKYRAAMRALASKVSSMEHATKACQEGLQEAKLSLWSANQEHNLVLSELEHLKRRSFNFLSLHDVDIVRRLKDGSVAFDQIDTVSGCLLEEVARRQQFSVQLATTKDRLEAAKARLGEQQAERRKLHSLLHALLSSPPASVVFEELKKHCKEEEEGEERDGGGNTPLVPLRSIFESLCNVCQDAAPLWDQLRFFSEPRPDDEGDEGHASDSLASPAVTTGEYIRVQLNEAVKLTIASNSGARRLVVKMDQAGYKLNEEEADKWLQVLLPSSGLTSASHLVDLLYKVKAVWGVEEELYEECSSEGGGPFTDLQRLKSPPHTFQLSVVSHSHNRASAQLTTAPMVAWKLCSDPASDEAFAARCRLVQDRLNTADMLSSPIALQLAFLRKLVQ